MYILYQSICSNHLDDMRISCLLEKTVQKKCHTSLASSDSGSALEPFAGAQKTSKLLPFINRCKSSTCQSIGTTWFALLKLEI